MFQKAFLAFIGPWHVSSVSAEVLLIKLYETKGSIVTVSSFTLSWSSPARMESWAGAGIAPGAVRSFLRFINNLHCPAVAWRGILTEGLKDHGGLSLLRLVCSFLPIAQLCRLHTVPRILSSGITESTGTFFNYCVIYSCPCWPKWCKKGWLEP